MNEINTVEEKLTLASPPKNHKGYQAWLVARTYHLLNTYSIAKKAVATAPAELKEKEALSIIIYNVCLALGVSASAEQCKDIIQNLMDKPKKKKFEKADYRHSKNSLERAKEIAAKRAKKFKSLVQISYLLRGKKAVIGIRPARVAAFLLSNPNAVVLTPHLLKDLVKVELSELTVWVLPELLEGFLEQHPGAKVLTPKIFDIWKKANVA